MGTLVFQATLGGSVNLIGPNTASTINFTLPSADGTSGQALATNGSGTLAFSSFATLVSNTFTGSQTLSAGTANGVTYLNGSKVLTSGSALTFDGSIFSNTGRIKTATGSTGGSFDLGYASDTGSRSYRVQNDFGVFGDFVIAQSTTQTGTTYNALYTALNSGTQYWSVGGTEGMRLTSTGLGIGTSSPSYKGQVTATVAAGGGGWVFGVQETTREGGLVMGSYGAANARVGAIQGLWWGNAAADLLLNPDGGNVGIGTSSPSQKLDVTVSSSTEGSGLAVTNSLTGGYGSGLTFYSLRSDTSAKVVAGSIVINGASAWNSNATTSSNMIFSTVGANTLAERGRFDSSGNLLVGTTSVIDSGALGLQIKNTTSNKWVFVTSSPDRAWLANITQASGTSYYAYFNYNSSNVGAISSTGTVTVYSTTSDYRLKTVHGALTGHGERIDALKPISYEWKNGALQDRGFLAHEFQIVYPNSVTGEKDALDADGKPVYQAMQAATSEVIADLVAEIQSLRVRVAQLETN
jgi:hypothetical protein